MLDPNRVNLGAEDPSMSYHMDSLRHSFKYIHKTDGSDPNRRYYAVDQSEAEFQAFVATAQGTAQLAKIQTPLCKSNLTLYLTMPPLFPDEPPTLTTFGGLSIPVPWEPKKSLLSEATLYAFVYLRQLWGLLQPPTLGRGDVPAVPHFTDDVVHDLIENDHAFLSYVYQLPYAKEIRTAEKGTLDLLEALSGRSDTLAQQLEQSQAEVTELETNHAQHAEALAQAKKDATAYLAYSTPDGLLKALAEEGKTEDVKAQMLADHYLHPISTFQGSSDNGSLVSMSPTATSSHGQGANQDDEDTLEAYFSSRVAYHQLELKRRSYAAQTPGH